MDQADQKPSSHSNVTRTGARQAGKEKDFNDRLRAARQSIEEKDKQNYRKGSAYSLGFRIATDLVVAVFAGFLIGYGLDTLIGTKPVFLLIFIFLGVAAGISNVIRVAKSSEAQRHMDHMSQSGKKTKNRADR